MFDLRILSVKIKNFRGIKGEVTLPLDAGLTVIYAVNGTGKSTLCHAVEWVLTGEVAEVPADALVCHFATGTTEVTCVCLLDGKKTTLVRTLQGATLQTEEGEERHIKDDELLAMLTPAEAGLKARSNIATRNKREWLRHSRWLYSHSLALLVDEAESEQRSQIFANILGYGHLLPQQKLLMDYLRYLPQSVSLYKKLRDTETKRQELEQKREHYGILATRTEERLTALCDALRIPRENVPPRTQLDRALMTLQIRQFDHQLQQTRYRQLAETWESAHYAEKELTLADQKHLYFESEIRSREEKQSERKTQIRALKHHIAEVNHQRDRVTETLTTLNNQWEMVSERVFETIGEYPDRLTLAQLQATVPESRLSSAMSGKRLSLLHKALAVHRACWPDEDTRKEWQEYIREYSDEAPLKARGERFQVLKEKRDSFRFRQIHLNDTLTQLIILGERIVSHSGESHCPLCSHDWEGNASLMEAIRQSESMLSPALHALKTELRQTEEEMGQLREEIRGLKVKRDRATSYQERLRRADKTFLEQKALLDVEWLTPLTPETWRHETLENYLTRLNMGRMIAEFADKIRQAERLLDDQTLRNDVALGDLPEEYRSRLTTTQRTHEVLLTNLARQQAELELKLGQESVLLNELISERNHIEIVLRGYRETWDSFRTLWDSFTGNAPVSQKTLSEYKNTLDNDLTADENITLLYEKAKLAVHAAVAGEDYTLLLSEEKELRQRIELQAKRKQVASVALSEVTHEIEKLADARINELIVPASELFSRMHANEVYKGLNIAGKGELRWRALVEGPGDNDDALVADSYFSQGQRQDLALSLYLARARSLGGTFFLDEPVAHLDDLNRAAMVDIFRVLSVQNPNMSLVLTTNSDLLRRHLIQKYALLSDQALTVITMTGNPHQGVDVTVSSTGRRPHFPDNRLPAPVW
ncbi:AAA family ATPase [Enterobacter cloacae complex sp. 2024EL-00215]